VQGDVFGVGVGGREDPPFAEGAKGRAPSRRAEGRGTRGLRIYLIGKGGRGNSVSNGERKWWKSGTAVVAWIALGTVAVHLATGWRYGFARDELMALDDARNLAWGYVPYPPMTVFFGWLAVKLFGPSLLGIRLFPALAQAVALVLTGLMAKEMGQCGVASDEWRGEKKVIGNQLSVIQDPGSDCEAGAPGGMGDGGGDVGGSAVLFGGRRVVAVHVV